jgi:hypothetical protein
MSTTIKRVAFVATALCTASIAAQAGILNGLELNAIAANAIAANGIALNALASNRIVLNGVEESSTAKAVSIDFGTLSAEVQLIQWLPKDKN